MVSLSKIATKINFFQKNISIKPLSLGSKNGYAELTKYGQCPQKYAIKIDSARGNILVPEHSINAIKELHTGYVRIAESVIDRDGLDGKILLPFRNDMGNTKVFHGKLIEHIAVTLTKNKGITLKDAKKYIGQEFKVAAVKYRNDMTWNKVETKFEHNNKEYHCSLTPAGEMTRGHEKKDIFAHSYGNKGICSASTTETKHATNLWMSEISASGEGDNKETLFKGIRHGVLSPYGLKNNDPERQAGALARAKEVVTAALYAKPDLLEQAFDGIEVPLQIVSTSLLTPSNLGGEDKMQEDQIMAWQSLSGQSPVILTVRGESGEERQVKVNLQVVALNFGVNELTLKFGLGQSASDKNNDQALKVLLGSDLKSTSPLGGMVAEYLKNKPENSQKVMELSQQLKQILENKSHHSDGGEPYKAAQRVTMLAYEIGAVPCWNCKSGKDRTGMLDAEIKREVVSQHQGQPLSKPNASLSDNNKNIFQKVLINGGNLEVQAYNTGAQGNKVLKKLPLSVMNLSYGERIGNRNVWKEAQGLSGRV